MSLLNIFKDTKVEQAAVTSIDLATGRVGLFLRNGLESTGIYLYDIKDLFVGCSVLATKVSSSYMILTRIMNNPPKTTLVTISKALPGVAKLEFTDTVRMICAASISEGFQGPPTPTFSIVSDYYPEEMFPMPVVISDELAVVDRLIYYTLNGTTPTEASILYNESHVDVPIFDTGSIITLLKAVAINEGKYSLVATLALYKMFNFVYSHIPPIVFLYDIPHVDLPIIDSGAIISVIVNVDTYEDPLQNLLPEISSGSFEDIIVHLETLEEGTFQMNCGIIDSGRYWNPIIEI